nr:integrase, catalytic region, zinc finger, CCHC-type, peptidase aspartic, catalytic [Tanacetum cinerariifolium]
IHVDFDELTAMASEQSSSRPALQEMTSVTISSGLVPKTSSSTSYVPPTRNDWDLLFQPLFDELLNPPPSVDSQDAEVIAPIDEVIPQNNDDSTGSPSLTEVDQDAPSLSHSPTLSEIQSPVIPQDVGNENLDIEVAHMGNDPLPCNQSIIRVRHEKTSYELMHGKQPDLSFFHVFGALCYPTNDSKNVGLVQKSSSSASYVPPSRNDWDLLFQPMFNELLNPPPSVDNQAAEVIAPIDEKYNPQLFFKMLEMIIWI